MTDSRINKSFGKWIIEERIGAGNTAVVYRARKGSAVAAVKVYNRDLVDRFGVGQQIDRINRQLSMKKYPHPSLIKIHAGGRNEATGDLFLVMDLIDGKPLNEALRLIEPERIGPIIAQIAAAARHLEKHGVVHRDIKPSNIAVDKNHGEATLLDLGVIRPMADRDADLTDGTTIGPFLGTVRYSPYEFIERKNDHSDAGWRALTFYQLGAVLHDLVTGRRLFDTVHRDELPKAIRSKEPDLTPRAGVPEHLVKLARKCLRKKWKERLEVRWEDFECRRLVRRPVVVLLYTGGTIGATVGPGGSTRILEPVEGDPSIQLDRYDSRTKRDYEQLHGPDIPLPFDLEWTALPREQQLLSENASPETWGHLAEGVERICLEYAKPPTADPYVQGNYLAGIIVLHGTDTLAYSAAALAFSLRDLPCPVVLTGSNQPPTDTVRERSLLASDYSDAWKNILRSLQFIQAIGHRFTEVFVCFNDTVHVALNLRKSAIDRSPQSMHEYNLQEPYFYRNRGALRQYAYRLIDGLYCNNLYPLSNDIGFAWLINDSRNRHRRESPLAHARPTTSLKFSDGVRLLLASPISLLLSDMREESEDDRNDFDILLLEGYNSGTFPTAKHHRFRSLLVQLQRNAVPIVLVTRNGLVPSTHEYQTEMIDGIETPILRMFGIIAETAAPLLSLVRARIPDTDWAPETGETSLHLLKRRHTLLRDGIERHFKESNSLLEVLLGNILDREQQRTVRMGEIQRREEDHVRRVDALFNESRYKLPTRGSKGGQWMKLPVENPRFDASLTVLLRQHFLWLFGEVVQSFATSNCGPDGLGFWNELGFSWGRRIRSTFLTRGGGGELLDRLPADRRDELLATVRQNEKRTTGFLFDYSVADVRTTFEVVPATEANHYTDGHLTLSVHAIKHGVGGRSDQLFTALSYRDDEAELFRRLREGAELKLWDHECEPQLQKTYTDLYANALNQKVSPLDWFLIGTYKAVMCDALRDLCFDPWVALCSSDERSYIEGLRQSIRTEVTAADTTRFDLRLHYTGRDVCGLKLD